MLVKLLRKIVNLSKLIYKYLFLLLFLLTAACSSYKPVKITYRLKLNSRPDLLKRTSRNKIIKYSKTKYFVYLGGSSPIAKLNNQAVEYALNRDFSEAISLFGQAKLEKKNLSALYNNIGLTYELMGDLQTAFQMYSQATLLEPNNKYFRKNLLLLDK